MATFSNNQRPGWHANIRGIVPRQVSDYVEYIHNTLTSFRTQQQAQNGDFLTNAPSVGVGNGVSANVTSPALGTGAGPANPHAVVGWQKVILSDGKTYYTPLFQ